MDKRTLNLYFVALCLILCLNVIDADPKRSFGLIRSRPKPNNLSIRRRQQQPAQYTPQSQAAAPAVAKPAVKPVASAPAAPVPAGPPPPYSPHPVKNIGASNAAPPPYTPYHAAPPSYQSAMGHGSPYPNANYPRQGYAGVNQGGVYNQGMQPNYGHTAMGGVGHPPYSGGMYNNGYNGGGMGMGGMNPGMSAGGMMGGMGGMGMGMGMGGGMPMGGMGGMGGMGYGYQQKPQSMFTMRNVLTGLALYSGARMIGGALSGGGGYGGGYGYGGGSQTQHVYLHHLNQPQVIVQGVPVAVAAQPGDPPASGVNSGVSLGVQPLNPVNAYSPIAYSNATSPVEVPAAPSGTTSPVITQTAQNGANENVEDPNIPTEIPLGLDSFPTIHPSLYTYAYGSEDILYWANSHNKNLSLSTDTTQTPTTQKSVTVSDMTV